MTKILLLTIFLAVKSLYIPLNKRKSKYYWRLKIDDRIPFLPIFIIPYLGYFVWILVAIIYLWKTQYINKFFVLYIISYILAGLFWYFFPNGVRRPIIKSKNIFSKITSFIYSIDDDTNGFPSAHIFGTLICSYFLILAFSAYSLQIFTVGFVISISTLFTKQHYLIDILGGILIFVLSIMISSILV
ncbi:MAG: Ser/Thr and Tyr protein phosphatase (Dual specificity) [Candidatus Roizmanbacteria bacterium GW2011_GWC2_37_13]|uniref:Ser/Thr and Tyr protein phosphatase (Dual specificity) n=1 Tax=Candidatus Roizmanbacteria bacterium GW2011_GWC2_37_13 TaxID=1618486 RepID=A0A0G0J9F0_9BACT|nr:MAG: Ser/Thr and Tyr protein phosphatase (Dual specificity) [Candidatus Roizmanbacteria bacterium GW2011_GWC1_37_12]KKQ24746.1 MAG: Ser/Thr and Tyr protein phosphatase (Dual specificity) [Candidatus Roizmanbacteria bacterium GW2011_GWC2_37_13]